MLLLEPQYQVGVLLGYPDLPLVGGMTFVLNATPLGL